MKLLKRAFFLFSIVLLYLVFMETVQLFYFAFNIHQLFGFFVVAIVGVFVCYFIILPTIKIIRIPRVRGPVKNKSLEKGLILERMKQFQQNESIKDELAELGGISNDIDDYKKVVEILKGKCVLIRKRYVSNLFYSSAISQNGFLDAIIILSASVGLVKETFKLYNGRVSNKDLWTIAKKVYYSVAIGGSEGVEIVTEEIISSLSSNSLKSIPFIDKVSGSIADGFVNAVLLTRISLITENYCTLTYIEEDKDMYPSVSMILKTAKMITSNMTSKIKSTIVEHGVKKVMAGGESAKDRTIEFFKKSTRKNKKKES
ncbi:DUF697 domain-containing protein [Candidatus Neomarinimicrobiota bacterium]